MESDFIALNLKISSHAEDWLWAVVYLCPFDSPS